MGLSNLKFGNPVVKTSGGDLAIRGLSLTDLMRLIATYRGAMEMLYLRISGDGAVAENMQSYGALLMDTAPEMAAVIIVMGTGDDVDDPLMISLANKIPAPDQIAILEAVAKATFAAEGGLKKALETIARIAVEMQTTVAQLQAPVSKKAT